MRRTTSALTTEGNFFLMIFRPSPRPRQEFARRAVREKGRRVGSLMGGRGMARAEQRVRRSGVVAAAVYAIQAVVMRHARCNAGWMQVTNQTVWQIKEGEGREGRQEVCGVWTFLSSCFRTEETPPSPPPPSFIESRMMVILCCPRATTSRPPTHSGYRERSAAVL